ncbi:bacillithiol biosynthesis deacetylase BshB1 [Pseudobacillus badius]|uniref:bacillithiol biosynthesis deacetylase BshB1 n=1 Tax=Bacillus badius TaxID=1455 RepID=UPI0007B06C12|nr:bacillithiol biosynthesis deacetylase BshB1 [Bacillus badius]KZN98988.1 bacillithiol biosynthesis deacetylase BshB1 [Bacillus badius]MED0664924.1 bacillithiol biosynthesis deacetylase BshB1 [Bacillus badius]OCS83924.1 bacillithiol biosynthesis deacetylase BshB1 [Bacillus badius]OVE52782.1 bacillithiol biosynthesis deacetylase BshB1 [Bacillus badius]TDW04802.1 bacillithiol biosynthesis deacetylase BshB1 [Bacillus badius]
METVKADILAFGAHADDIEIGMGGTAAKYAAAGKKVIFCDLTKAELSSNGTVASRLAEAKEAASLLGVYERVGLDLPDRGLFLTEEAIRVVAEMIRRYRPTVIFAPYEKDRHPDHGACSRIVQEAFFSAGIRKYQTPGNEGAHKASRLYFYMINGFHHPDFCIDISNFMDRKKQSLRAYESQFEIGAHSVATPLTNGYIEAVEARDRLMGKEVGRTFAEGFLTNVPLVLEQDLIGDLE